MRRHGAIALIVIMAFAVSSFSMHAKEGQKRALTVFISEYPAQSGWKKIHSHNDKPLVLGMLKNLGFSERNIICLEDSEATLAGIQAAFERLIGECRPGDKVYIHFSCHGQQITDVDGDEGLRNPRNKYDESLIPYDACISYGRNGYDGSKHLIDDQINDYLCRICGKVGRKGTVMLVADACHSGEIQREYDDKEDSTSLRGVADVFELPLTGRTCENLPREASCVAVSACKEFESNHECEIGGKKYGRLTYAVSLGLRKGMTVKSFRQALTDNFKKVGKISPLPKNRTQSPYFEIPESYQNRILF